MIDRELEAIQEAGSVGQLEHSIGDANSNEAGLDQLEALVKREVKTRKEGAVS